MAEYGIYLNIGTIVTLILATGSIVWKLSLIEKEIRADMDAQIDNLQRDTANLERAGLDRAEIIRHEFGETGSAIRQKIHDIETWNRDTFVRKDSFELVTRRIEKSIEKLGDRFEEKLEKLITRIQQN